MRLLVTKPLTDRERSAVRVKLLSPSKGLIADEDRGKMPN